MVDKKDDDTDFDDDAFDDVEEFADTDFDEDALEDDNEFAELSPDDVDDDFAEEDGDWQDDKALSAKSKKQKAPREKGDGLSFNAMVMIGAFVVGGGVLVFNVMTQSAEQSAGKKGVFQSIMSMAGVMDGTLSGNDDDATPAATGTGATAQSDNKPDAAFLNNPDTVVPNPPPPTPIAPAETGEALTPLPNTAGETPRGPDEAPPGATPAPATPDTDVAGAAPSPGLPSDVPVSSDNTKAAKASAEDILKQAMANHDQKKTPDGTTADESAPEPTKVADANPDAASKIPPDVTAATPAETAAKAITPDRETPLVMPPDAPVAPAADAADVVANKQAVADLQGKIDTLLKRMDQIESDLGSVKESKGDYQQIETTVNSLKDEIATIKDRPAAPAPSSTKFRHAKPVVQEDAQPAEEATPAPEAAPIETASSDEPKAAPAPKKKVKKAAAPVAVSGKWELRAAQPGRAWVSKPGARDMQGVEVGQTLAGIGKVTAISYQNGRWTVYGTTGQINQ